MNFAVFCYDFPHWKTQTGLFALHLNDLRPRLVIAAPWRELTIRKSKTRITHNDLYLEHPRKLCERYWFEYVSMPHDAIKSTTIDFAIILGARILKKETISAFKHGVINFHPGILPENRGLDNVKWAVKKQLPQGVTAHFINEYVDSGKIIGKHEIPIYKDDTLLDLQFRVQNAEIIVMVNVVKAMLQGKINPMRLSRVPADTNTFKCLSDKDERTLEQDLINYKRRFCA